MSIDKKRSRHEKPTDKYAQSDQAPPPGKRRVDEFISDVDAEGVVDKASEDSFPASDPPAYTTGRVNVEQPSDHVGVA